MNNGILKILFVEIISYEKFAALFLYLEIWKVKMKMELARASWGCLLYLPSRRFEKMGGETCDWLKALTGSAPLWEKRMKNAFLS